MVQIDLTKKDIEIIKKALPDNETELQSKFSDVWLRLNFKSMNLKTHLDSKELITNGK